MAEREDGLREDQSPRRPRRRSRLLFVIVILVLILLLVVCSSSVIVFRGGPRQVSFVARNVECLKCHTEMLAEMTRISTHFPFIEKQCTSCHHEHAKLVTRTVSGGGGSTVVESSTWLRWGPFRHIFGWVERVVLRIDEQAQKRSEEKAVGPARLRSSSDRLCWLCHGNLTPELAMGFPHQPFAAGHCLSCHDPHASDDAPLLHASAKDLCTSCHPIGREISRAYPHPPAEQRRCLECHDPHASDWRGILVASQRDLCFTCHPTVAVLSLDEVQHQPFEGDNCTGCHEPHGAEHRPLLSEATPELCCRCHEAIDERFTRASHHPLGTKVDCTSCHMPHASGQTALLVRPQRQLCLGCHDEIVPLSLLPVQHGPFADDPCTACHVPHGSPYAPLLKNPKPNLCYMCHPAVATDMNGASHHPEDCSRCHEVHAGRYASMLFAEKGNGLCYRCHASVGVTYVESPHNVIDCADCHGPHGSPYVALLRANPTATCTQCHKPTAELVFVGDGDQGHRATPTFYDMHAKAPLTCSSTCHNPHGTDYRYMIRNWPWYLDGLCLQCHPGVGIRF